MKRRDPSRPNSISPPIPPIRSSTSGGTVTNDDSRSPARPTPRTLAPQDLGTARVPRVRKDRRRRIDPTTFEKQYTDDELEFMNAVQYFKVQSGKSFPSHGDVLRVAASLGYRKAQCDEPLLDDDDSDASGETEPSREEYLPV